MDYEEIKQRGAEVFQMLMRGKQEAENGNSANQEYWTLSAYVAAERLVADSHGAEGSIVVLASAGSPVVQMYVDSGKYASALYVSRCLLLKMRIAKRILSEERPCTILVQFVGESISTVLQLVSEISLPDDMRQTALRILSLQYTLLQLLLQQLRMIAPDSMMFTVANRLLDTCEQIGMLEPPVAYTMDNLNALIDRLAGEMDTLYEYLEEG